MIGDQGELGVAEGGRPFLLGPVRVDPASGELSGPGGNVAADPKVMAVLMLMASRAGLVVSRDELLARVWPGVVVSDDAVSRCVYVLRGHLAEASGDPVLREAIETLPRRGWRLHLRPQPLPVVSEPPLSRDRTTRPRRRLALAPLLVLPVVLAVAALWLGPHLPRDAPAADVPQAAADRARALHPEAWAAYRQGREMLDRRSPRAATEATRLFSRALALEPAFAEALAERGIAFTLSSLGGGDAAAALGRARADIDRALALDPDLARAHAAQGLLLSQTQPGEHAEREAALRRALAFDPGMVDALNWLSILLSGQERRAEADALLERAASIDPLSPAVVVNLATSEDHRGMAASAEARLRRLLDAPARGPVHFQALIAHYALRGRFVEAMQLAQRASLELSVAQDVPSGVLQVALLHASLGDWPMVHGWLDRIERRWPGDPLVRAARWRMLGTYDPGTSHAAAADGLRAELERAHAVPGHGGSIDARLLGTFYALAGDHSRAIDLLGPLVARDTLEGDAPHRQALAHALRAAGREDEASRLLQTVADRCEILRGEGRLGRGDMMVVCAGNHLLRGEVDVALSLLAAAVDSGWCEVLAIEKDPRWDAVRGHETYRRAVAKAREAIREQATRIAAMDAEAPFAARFDAEMALRGARPSRLAGPSR